MNSPPVCIKCKIELREDAIYCDKCGKKQVVEKKRRTRHSNGSGTVTKLSGNRKKPWVALAPGVWNEKNKKWIRPIIKTFEKEQDARKAAMEASGASAREIFNYTLEDVYNAWSPAHFASLKSKNGREGYANAWNHIPPNLRVKKMRDCRKIDFQGPIDKIAADGKSKSLCEKVQQLESQLCQWAIDHDLMDKNHARKIDMPVFEATANKRAFTKDEIASIYSYKDDFELWEIARIVLCWIYTGTRTNELLLIESSKVNLHKGYMIGGLKTDAGKDRIIPIHPVIRPFVEVWYDMGGDYLIPNHEGLPHNDGSIRKRFNRFMKILGFEGVEPRTARRSCATTLSREGVRPEIISRLLGHVEYDTTEIYIMNNLQDLVGAIGKMPAPMIT